MKKNIKIKVMQLGSSSGLYGAERWILALIRNLDSSIVETWVSAIRDVPNSEVQLCNLASQLGFKSVVFDSYGKFSFSGIRKLRNFIIKNEMSILHTHGYKTDIIGLLATTGTACKLITTPHGWTDRPDFKLWIYEWLDRLVFPFFDAVVPLSEGLFASISIIPFLKRKLHLVRNGVDILEIEEAVKNDFSLSPLGDENVFTIGYIGRLTPGKGLDTLFMALAARSDRPSWQIALIGEGEQEQELRSLAKQLGIVERVKFFGFRSDRLSFLKDFDVFVLPSKSEGIPRCIMEAMVAEVPVIASDIPGCRQLVTNNITGLLFQVDDHESLFNCLDLIQRDSKKTIEMFTEAKKLVCLNYSANMMATEYVELYKKMIH